MREPFELQGETLVRFASRRGPETKLYTRWVVFPSLSFTFFTSFSWILTSLPPHPPSRRSSCSPTYPPGAIRSRVYTIIQTETRYIGYRFSRTTNFDAGGMGESALTINAQTSKLVSPSFYSSLWPFLYHLPISLSSSLSFSLRHRCKIANIFFSFPNAKATNWVPAVLADRIISKSVWVHAQFWVKFYARSILFKCKLLVLYRRSFFVWVFPHGSLDNRLCKIIVNLSVEKKNKRFKWFNWLIDDNSIIVPT